MHLRTSQALQNSGMLSLRRLNENLFLRKFFKKINDESETITKENIDDILDAFYIDLLSTD